MRSASYVRPMTTSEVYAAAFELYRRCFRPLLAINFIYTVLVIVLNYLNRPGVLRLGPTLAILTELVQIYIYAVVVIAASNAVLGRPVRVAPAFQRAAAPRALAKMLVFALPLPLARLLYLAFFPAATATLTLAAYVGGGLAIFLVMFVFRIFFLFAAPVSVLEKRGLLATVRRVVRLSAAFALPNFWRYGLFFVPFQALRALASVVLVAGFLLGTGPTATIDDLSLFLLQQIPLGLVILFLNPLRNLVATLLYYDARARQEGYDREVLAEEMGYQPLTELITA